jgi:hypothetical protein
MAREICDKAFDGHPLSQEELEDRLSTERERMKRECSPQEWRVVDQFMTALQGDSGPFAEIVRLIQETRAQ